MMNPPAGVVDNLRRVHQAIRPGGLTLDIHPQPEHARVKVVRADRVITAERLDSTRFIGKVLPSRAAPAEQVAVGLFVTEQATTFEYLTGFDGVEEWLAYMAAEWTGAAVPPALAERVRALLPDGVRLIRVREAVHATRQRRTEPASSQGR